MALWSFYSSHSGRVHTPEALKEAQAVLEKADLLILTLSTDHGYYLKETLSCGSLVANCHKMPSKMFEEKVTSLEQSISVWESVLPLIKAKFPQLHLLWTVSPYRYAKHGMHESQLSKARLHLTIDHLIHPKVANANSLHQENESMGLTDKSRLYKKITESFAKNSEIFGNCSEFFEKMSENLLKKSEFFYSNIGRDQEDE